jgi:hypothetical protein
MIIFWIVLFITTVIASLSFAWSLYIFRFFRKLSQGVGRNDLIKILTNLSEIEKKNSENIRTINKVIEGIKKDTSYHIQKTSLVKFNPFSELGGDHSFSLALLDAHSTGYIITGLHTRERTRVYIKNVEKGKCKQDLSKEEQEALDGAFK